MGSVMKQALLSREQVENDDEVAFIFEGIWERKDPEWVDHISLSISRINLDLFNRSRTNFPDFWALVLFPGVMRRRPRAGCPRRCWRSAFSRALEDVHAIGTRVATLRPSVKGAAARLAVLGPDGPPLTAGLRSAGWQ